MKKKFLFLLLFLCILTINYFLLGINHHLEYTKFESRSDETPNLSGLDGDYDVSVPITNISKDHLEFSKAAEEDKIPSYDIIILISSSTFILLLIYWYFKRENFIKYLP